MNQDIYKTIPHRPPFLFVDKILEQREDGILTQRKIRADEFYFEGHYPGNPIMPGVLLCESVFQTAAIYLVKKFEVDGADASALTPVLSRIEDARFKQMVKPGDVCKIEVTMKETISHFHFLKGKVSKGDKVVMTVSFALALIDEKK